jgi:hypothetical protein
LEETLKKTVVRALEQKLGCTVVISHREWEDAIQDSLNDIYANRLCYFKEVTPECFVNIMVGVLLCARSVSA